VKTIDDGLARPEFQRVWQEGNRRAAEKLTAIVEGEKLGLVDTANGAVTLDLRPLVVRAATRVGVPAATIAKIPPEAGQLTVFTSSDLHDVQSYVKLILAGWLAGPGPLARRVRAWLAPWLAHRLALSYTVVALLLALLIWWGPVAWLHRFVPVLVLIALVIAGVELLRRQTAREHPGVPYPDPGALWGGRGS